MLDAKARRRIKGRKAAFDHLGKAWLALEEVARLDDIFTEFMCGKLRTMCDDLIEILLILEPVTKFDAAQTRVQAAAELKPSDLVPREKISR